MNTNLNLEAEAFDNQIIERVQHGHIPDLRYSEFCSYFYNNVWRYPYMVQMDIGEVFEIIRGQISNQAAQSKPRVLEVGCGPGFISLELARAGFDVVGIDLSPKCIEIAVLFADRDPEKATRGDLQYICGDFFSNQHITGFFDAVVFVGALHHFPNPRQVLARVASLLSEGGIICVHEPTRDRVKPENAAVLEFTKTLVSLLDGYYERSPSFDSTEEIHKSVRSTFDRMRYETEEGKKAQSVNDNSSGWAEMLPALREQFEEIFYEDRYGFFHEIIGGLRFPDEKNHSVAKAIKLFDKYLCEKGVIQATEFYFTGRRRIEYT